MNNKERLDTGAFSLDSDLDFDSIGDFDFGDSTQKKRSTAKSIKAGMKEAAKRHFSNESNIQNHLTKALPKEYGEAFSAYTGGREVVHEAIDDIKKTLKQPVNEFTKALLRNTPERFKKTHNFLGKLVEKTEDELKNAQKKMAGIDEDALTLSIAKVFEAQDQDRREEKDADEARSNIEKTAELIRFKGQTNTLNSIARSSDIMAKYAVTVNQAFQKKSLELQYRTVFGIRDMVEQTKLLTAQLRTQLDAIQHNTGLPETQKIHLSERFSNSLKNKFIGSTIGGFQKGGQSFLQAALHQGKGSAKNFAEMLAMGLQGGSMGLDTAQMMGGLDFDEEEDPRQAMLKRRAGHVSDAVLGMGGTAASSKIMKALLKRFPKLADGVQGTAHRMGYLGKNAESIAKGFAYGGLMDEGAGMGILRDIVAGFMPTLDTDMKMSTDKAADLRSASIFDNRTRRSITEVIPGYLAKILRELEVTRTGDTNTSAIHFDFNKSKFTSGKEILSGYNDRIKEANAGGAQQVMKGITEHLQKSGTTLTPEQEQKLQEALLKARVMGKTVNPSNLMGRALYEQLGVGEHADAYQQLFRSHFGSTNGKFEGNAQNLAKRNKLFSELQDAQERVGEGRSILQEAYDSGHGELLRQAGWTNDKDQADLGRYIAAANGGEFGVPETQTAGAKARRMKRPGTASVKPSMGQYAPRAESDMGSLAPVLEQIAKSQKQAVEQLQALREESTGTKSETKNLQQLESLVTITTEIKTVLMGIAEQNALGLHTAASPQGGASMAAKEGMDWKSVFHGAKAHTRQTGTRLRSMFGGAKTSKAASDAKNFWNRTVGENIQAIPGALAGAAERGRNLAGKLFGWVKTGADKVGESASKSRLMGARIFSDFKDGLPMYGDVFVRGEKEPRIQKILLEQGFYRDSAGKVIKTITDLADATGDILDEAGEVVLTRAQLLKSYVKSNGTIFAQVFIERVKRGAARAGQGIAVGLFNLYKGGRRAGLIAGTVKDIAMEFGKEIFMPPRDVYVKGEDKPRLFAYAMRLGQYFNQDGSVISRPTLIKGPVTDSLGNELISALDIQKGLVDVLGNPFKTIKQRVGEATRKMLREGTQRAASLARATGKFVRGAIDNSKIFLRSGLSGFAGDSTVAGSAKVGGFSSKSHSVLEQIRDILDARLPKGYSGETQAPQNPNAPLQVGWNGQTDSHSSTESTTNVLDGLTRGFSSLSGKAMGALGSVWGKMRGKKGGKLGKAGAVADVLSSTTGTGASGGADEDTLEKKIEDSKESTIKATQTQNKSLFGKISSMISKIGGRGRVDVADGKKNSWKDQAANQHNINEVTKTKDDFAGPREYQTQNSIDLILNLIKNKGAAAAGAVSSILNGAGDAADVADTAHKTGEWSKAGKAVKTAEEVGEGALAAEGVAKAAGKGGIFTRSARMLGRGVKYGMKGARAVGRFAAPIANTAVGLIKPAAGAVARSTALKAGVEAAGIGARFALTRGLMAGAGVIGAILGAPVVGTALAIGGAAWTAYDIYKFFSKDKHKDEKGKNITSSSDVKGGTIEMARMAEYGLNGQATNNRATVLWLEDYLYGHTDISDTQAKIDEKSVDAQPIAERFGIDLDNENQLARFTKWLENRFKPNFLKYVAVAKGLKLKSLTEIGNLKPSQQLELFKAVATKSEGYDCMVNPFSTVDDLDLGPSEVKDIKSAILHQLEVDAKKAGSDEKASKDFKPGDAKADFVHGVINSVQAQSKDGSEAGVAAMAGVYDQAAKNAKLAQYQIAGTKDLGSALAGANVTLVTNPITALPSKTITALTGIRWRMYGATALTRIKAKTFFALELILQDMVTVDKDGKASFSGDLLKVFDQVKEHFGFTVDATARLQAWQTWMTRRVLPVFTTYAGQVTHYTSQKDLQLGIASMTPAQMRECANALLAIPGVWTETTSPWLNDALNTDPESVQDNLAALDEQVKTEKLREETKKPKYSDTPATTPAVPAAPASSKQDATQPGFGMQKTSFPSSSDGASTSTSTVYPFAPKAQPAGDAPRSALSASKGYAGGVAQMASEVENRGAAPGNTSSRSGSVLRDQAAGALDQAGGSAGAYTSLVYTPGRAGVMDLVKTAANSVGVDPTAAATTVAIESGFKTGAKAGTSSATGLYQFTSGTWREMMKKYASKYGIPQGTGPEDAKANALLGAQFMKDNAQSAARAGLPTGLVTSYAMHFLGESGGKQLLAMPDDHFPAMSMRKAAAANKEIFYLPNGQARTKVQVVAELTRRLSRAAKGFGIDVPATEVAAAGPKAAAAESSSAASDVTAGPAGASSIAVVDKSAGSTGTADQSPGLMDTVYRPDASQTQRQAAVDQQPTVAAQAKDLSAPGLQAPLQAVAARRDMQDSQTGTLGSDQQALVTQVSSQTQILQASHDVLVQILDAIKSSGAEKSADAGPSAASATPDAPARSTQPDRSPRTVSQPAVSLKVA